MIKFRINKREESDVQTMTFKDWTVKLYRAKGRPEWFTVTKENIQFVIRETDDGETITIQKYVDGECVDIKSTNSQGNGIAGTLYINDHKSPARCYCFFRNETVQNMLNDLEIDQLTYYDDGTNRDRISEFRLGKCPDTDAIVTDGRIEFEDDEETGTTIVYVVDCHFVYCPWNNRLIVPYYPDIDMVYEYVTSANVREEDHA